MITDHNNMIADHNNVVTIPKKLIYQPFQTYTTQNTNIYMSDKKRLPYDDPQQYIKTVKEKLEMDNLEGLEQSDQYTKIMTNKALIAKERLFAIEKIFELYPNLKKDFEVIKNHVMGLKGQRATDDAVLNKIFIDGSPYYIDKTFNILNADTKIIGCYIETNNGYTCFLRVEPNRNLNMWKHVDAMSNTILNCNSQIAKTFEIIINTNQNTITTVPIPIPITIPIPIPIPVTIPIPPQKTENTTS